MSVCQVSLLGAGKTGSLVVELCQKREDIQLKVFDSKNLFKLEDLKKSDVVICFLTGEVFKTYLPLLLQHPTPLVTGSTGFEFPAELDEKLKQMKTTWVHATNFALGMTLVKQMIEVLGLGQQLFPPQSLTQKIHEVHHTQKKDAPSGTALSWQAWAGSRAQITSERIGDVIGEHELTFETPFERITLKHEAKDRRVFAEGALWAALELVKRKDKYQTGLLDIHQMTRISTQGMNSWI